MREGEAGADTPRHRNVGFVTCVYASTRSGEGYELTTEAVANENVNAEILANTGPSNRVAMGTHATCSLCIYEYTPKPSLSTSTLFGGAHAAY